MKHKAAILMAVLLVAIGGVAIKVLAKPGSHATKKQSTPGSQPVSKAQGVHTEPAFNKKLYSTTDPSSIWFINNKVTGLPLTYVPSDLIVPNLPLRLAASEEQMHFRKVAEADLEQLFTDGKAAGLQLQFGSGYRSAAYQKTLYDGYVASSGQAEADRSSARPGHSEHQTGLTLDFTRQDGKCHLDACFGDTAEGKWLAENAYKYGFILRYTPDKEKITGYEYEPWHFRYVGRELAAEMHKTGIKTLEEFFGTGAAPDYVQ